MPGPKRGGSGSREGKVDGTMHITILRDDRRAVHLRLDARGHVFEISVGSTPQSVRAWMSPGSS